MKRVSALILCVVLVLNMTVVSFAGGEAGSIQSASYGNNYVIKDDGSLWGWGGNDVGNGTSGEQLTPVKILENVRSVSVGGISTYVAVKKDDTLWGWGYFYGSPAADGPRYLSPVKFDIDDVKEAAAGAGYVLVLKNDNTLWLNGNMILGNGTIERATEAGGFVKIQDNVLTMNASDDTVFFIKEDNTLWGFGDNSHAQLGNKSIEGDGLTNSGDVHTAIKILDDVKSIKADSDGVTIFAIRLDNSLYAWGDSGFYTEENGWVEEAGSPYKVMDGVKTVAVDGDVAFIVKTDDSLWAWGYDYQGLISTDEKTPYKVLDGVSHVTVGARHASIIKTDNTLWTMGGNYRGGLGHTGDETWYTPLTKILSNIQDAPASWALVEVEKAIGEKLIPEDMQSNYTKSITREEFCILAIKMIEVKFSMTIDEYLLAVGLEIAPSNSFTDCDTKEVLAAKALGITNGMTPTTFEPDKLLSREEAAKFLTTTAIACGQEVELNAPPYADLNDIAGWAQNYTGYVFDIGVMKGTGANKFSPRDSYQRQQAFMTMYRIWKAIDSVTPEKVGASNDASVFTMDDYSKTTKYTEASEITTILNSLNYAMSEDTKNMKFTFKEISPERSEDVTVLYSGNNIREERPQGLNGDTTFIFNAEYDGTYGIVKPGNYEDFNEGNELYMYRLSASMLEKLENDSTVLSVETSVYLGIFHIEINRGDMGTEKYGYSVDSGMPLSYIKMMYDESGDLESQVDWEQLEIDSTVVTPDSLFEIPADSRSRN